MRVKCHTNIEVDGHAVYLYQTNCLYQSWGQVVAVLFLDENKAFINDIARGIYGIVNNVQQGDLEAVEHEYLHGRVDCTREITGDYPADMMLTMAIESEARKNKHLVPCNR